METLTFKGVPMAKNSKVTIAKLEISKIKLARNSRIKVDKDELDGLMSSIKEARADKAGLRIETLWSNFEIENQMEIFS